jgi:hypothetical protein
LKKTITKSGQRAKQLKLYKYSEQLSFLKNCFEERVTKGNINSQKDEEDDQDDSDTQQREDKEVTAQGNAEEPTVSDLNEDFQIQPPPSISIKVLLNFQEYQRHENRQERKWCCNKLVQQNYWST